MSQLIIDGADSGGGGRKAAAVRTLAAMFPALRKLCIFHCDDELLSYLSELANVRELKIYDVK